MVLDGDAYTFNGSTWSQPMEPDQDNQVWAVSCPSSSFCAAFDDGGDVLTFNGSTWSAPTEIESGEFVGGIGAPDISCTSSSFCVVVDGIGHALMFNGRSWSAPLDVDRKNNLNSVSCASRSLCVAVDLQGNAVVFNGRSWSAPAEISGATNGRPNPLESDSCVPSAFCVAAGGPLALIYGQAHGHGGPHHSNPFAPHPCGPNGTVTCG
jgi:hypothetical protein